MKSSSKDNVEGKLHQGKGKVKEAVGKVTGNSELEAEGVAENLEGKIQEKVGEVKKVIGK
jgi:uncharacterized protein YjbJ (UPF0337 family)